MHFTVPVPADVHELEFSWQSLIAYPLPYAISIEYANDQDALGTPTLSIPHKGLVPQEIESFLVYLPCTGNASLQLPVNVNMVVRGPPRFNDTRLHFKRNKICAKVQASPPRPMAATRTCSSASTRSDGHRVPLAPTRPSPASTNTPGRRRSRAAYSTVSAAPPFRRPTPPPCSRWGTRRRPEKQSTRSQSRSVPRGYPTTPPRS
ncbi:tyrosine-protein kinase Drl-like isoform X2 [Drosophila guanche]|uniref:tyrosine-protein kinase Drl-like isoform X2 n=1 Tax=Drosophila guanche TaxID=7266 RepID=UPI00147132E5|nr:tyrosine-protein kinase Drl-like isoform X2 [Drosophila guanche]